MAQRAAGHSFGIVGLHMKPVNASTLALKLDRGQDHSLI